MKSKLFKIFVILLFSAQINAQKISFFKPITFAKPFISDTRSPIIKLEIGRLNKVSPVYYVNDGLKRPFIETHFGYEIPVFSYSKNDFNIYLDFPGGAGTLVDIFEEKTAPVINTDFWFGTEIKLIKRFSGTSYLKNIAADILPLFHESTHIGDEFALHGHYEIPDFKRVNISYEAWKLSLILNDPDTLKGNILSLKAGIQNLWTIKDGYYFTDSTEVKGADVPKSNKTFEWYFSANYQRSKGFLCSEKFVNILSAEINNRPQFSYDTAIPETRTWSYNIYFGWEYKVSNKPYRNVDFFLRHYSGLNPHGQFRNENGFRFTGFSVVLM